MMFKRLAFVDFIEAMLVAGNQTHAQEGRDTIFPKMGTLERFVDSFGRSKSSAAVGAKAGAIEEDFGEEDEETSLVKVGVANATAVALDAFVKTLTPTGKRLADLVAKTHGGAFDAEFLEIAHAEARGGNSNFCTYY